VKTLLVICGPTASGKTELAISKAKEFSTEIISADSRQFYKELNIGTAKPSKEQLTEVKHHFIDSHSITETFTAGNFETEGLKVLNELFKTKDTVVLVGGSGLYINALVNGFDEMPEVDQSLRKKLQELYEKEGITALQKLLEEKDPEYFAQVDLKNPQRLIRALEVSISGAPYSSYRKNGAASAGPGRNFQVKKIAIDFPREELYKRIDKRVDAMMEQGLLEEVKGLVKYKGHNALNTVGYTELFDYLEGKTDLEEAVRLIKRNTRHYAKRQLTWFRRDLEISWLVPG
jgi:tRNA dimethylallyltransferase